MKINGLMRMCGNTLSGAFSASLLFIGQEKSVTASPYCFFVMMYVFLLNITFLL